MKLYVDMAGAPNPRRVKIFLKEKGIEIPFVPLDLGKKHHKTDDFTAKNPMQRVPALELDDGTVISESVAICRYFEEIQPEPLLFGKDPVEKATIEMWNRRIDHNLGAAIMAVFRHTHPAMAELEVPQIGAWAEANRPRLMDVLSVLNEVLSGREHIAGNDFSIADISALCYIDFLKPARVAIPDDHVHLLRWRETVSARPSMS